MDLQASAGASEETPEVQNSQGSEEETRAAAPSAHPRGPEPNEFQSTRPARGATGDYRGGVLHEQVSIHAPRAGRDWGHRPQPAIPVVSIDAPRARGATGVYRGGVLHEQSSIHAPRGGRDWGHRPEPAIPVVSIHAPRAG